MPITAIINQPAPGSLNAAYRPVLYTVTATRTDGQVVPPVVYADLYLNGIYYRSQSHTQPDSSTGTDSTWTFDIQDLVQPFLRHRIGPNGGSVILPVPESFVTVQVRFRSSGYSTDGFVIPEDMAPVQGTGNTAPIAGTGTASEVVYVVNVTLQHASNQNLAIHLSYFKNRTWGAAYPLTHRPDNTRVGVADTDYYPIFTTAATAITQLRLMYRTAANTTYSNTTTLVNGGQAAIGAYLVPLGPVNLTSLFPAVVFATLYDYTIQALDSNGSVVATSNINRLSRCAEPDKVRVHFLNYLGQYDTLQFNRPRITHEDDGETYIQGLSAIFTKTESLNHRWNVRANDTYELTVKCLERDLLWVQELADSVQHYMEWKGIEGQPDSYLPLVKQKGTFDKVKNDGSDWEYVYQATFSLGNPVIAIRG